MLKVVDDNGYVLYINVNLFSMIEISKNNKDWCLLHFRGYTSLEVKLSLSVVIKMIEDKIKELGVREIWL